MSNNRKDNKLNFTKIKNICFSKDTEENEKETHCNKILVDSILDKQLASRICQQLL